MQKNPNLIKTESWECMEKRADRKFKKAVLAGNQKLWDWRSHEITMPRYYPKTKKELSRIENWGESKHAHKAFRADNRKFRHNRNYLHEAQDEECALWEEPAELDHFFAQDPYYPLLGDLMGYDPDPEYFPYLPPDNHNAMDPDDFHEYCCVDIWYL